MPAGQPRRHRRFCDSKRGRQDIGRLRRSVLLRGAMRRWRLRACRLPSARTTRCGSPVFDGAARHAGLIRGMRIARSGMPKRPRCGSSAPEKFAQFLRKWTCAAPNRPAGRRRVMNAGRGVPSASGVQRIRSHATSRQARPMRACIAKCLFFSDLRIDGARHRCAGCNRVALHRGGRMPVAADRREARPEKKCAGLLTGQKTVIRFRPAEVSCGIK